jgi:uncharacterized protein (TIGR00251 family)
VVPGASRERIAGLHDGRVRIAVSAPPERGKANKALIAFVAATLGLRKNQVSIVRGEKDREKDLLIVDGQAKDILSKLEPFIP